MLEPVGGARGEREFGAVLGEISGKCSLSSHLMLEPQTHSAGVFNVFQAKDPQTDGEMERGPPTHIYCIKLCFILNCHV